MNFKNLAKMIDETKIATYIENEPLSNHSSIKIGKNIRILVYPNNTLGLIEIIKYCNKYKINKYIIGRGSNVLFLDEDINAVFIKLEKNFNNLKIEKNIVTVGAGYQLKKLAKLISKNGFSGLEFAGGIPATLGGAIYMNAGAHTGQISDCIKSVTVLDENCNILKLNSDDCLFEYRKSIFQEKKWTIIECELEFKKGDKAQIFKKMSGNLEYRKEMQPLDKLSFGSVFRNPPNNHAGKLIEDYGLKEKRIGGASFSKKHANFIINEGNATRYDVISLINLAIDTIKKETGIKLEVEVEIFKDDKDEQ